jgi:hypothetical protein
MKIKILPEFNESYIGGPKIFRDRLIEFLKKNKFELCEKVTKDTTALLIINATIDYYSIIKALYYNVPIYTRVGSIYRSNLHEDKRYRAKILYFISLIRIIINILISKGVIYQSTTVKTEWNKIILVKYINSCVIYNPKPDFDNKKILAFKNSLVMNIENSIKLMYDKSTIVILAYEANHPDPFFSLPFLVYNNMMAIYPSTILLVIGNTDNRWELIAKNNSKLKIYGRLPSYNSLIHIKKFEPIFIGSDVLPAGCPNSVIEVMSLGIPILGYKNTATHEISDDAGIFIEANKIDLLNGNFKNIDKFTDAAKLIKNNYKSFSLLSKRRSKNFSNDKTLLNYINYIIK